MSTTSTSRCREMLARASEPGERGHPDVLRHLESCEGCREALRAVERLEQTRLEPEAGRMEGLAARIARRHDEERGARDLGTGLARRKRLAGWGAGALGAAAAAALLLWMGPAPRRVVSGDAGRGSGASVAAQVVQAEELALGDWLWEEDSSSEEIDEAVFDPFLGWN